MTSEATIALIGAGVITITITVVIIKMAYRRAPLKLKKKKFQKQWKDLQAFCKNKDTWPEAILRADKLLDKALLKRGYKGKNTGERLVSAQRKLSDNDSVWFGHKLSRKIEEDPNLKLKEEDVKDALLGIGQALKDLNAL